MRDPTSKYQFPWRSGNHFELLVDGREFFPRMLEAVEMARAQVWLEMYLFESGTVADRFIDALARAARRGLDVRVLLDDYGATRLREADRARLTESGVQLKLYNPLQWRKWLGNLFRDHRKLLVVDDHVAFVGGAGITDEFDHPHDPARSWRETMIRVAGPVLADWQELFLRVWHERVGPGAAPVPPPPAFDDGLPGRVTPGVALRVQDIRRSLYNRLRTAERRIWIVTAYFVPSRRKLRALREAALRGMDVRLLLPGPHTDHPAVRHAGRRFYSGLLKSGVRVFEYQPRFLHAKTVVCDDWVSVGSSNMDRWNLRWNLEANQEVDGRSFAEAACAVFENDLRDSLEIHYSDWHRRGLRARLRERLWGRVDMLLESIGRLRGVRMK
jgi:phosphatidylserine/phosphatidylglycerophosphate/cardiolipin synthase-like enzyme